MAAALSNAHRRHRQRSGGPIEVLSSASAILNGKWYGKMAFVVTTLTLDKTGRLVLPKPVRDELQLRPGDSLELESSEERIVLRPARGNARIRKKQGIWVLHGGGALFTRDGPRKIARL